MWARLSTSSVQNKTGEHQKSQGEQQQKEHQNGGEQQKHEKKVPSNVQEYNQMLREVTERIANDFVSLSNILKLGERFHTTPLIGGNTMYNLTAMWSKCVGVNLPHVVQQYAQSQQAVGASILSQDTDFFESDWFGDMIDDVVKKVMSGIQDNPSTSFHLSNPLFSVTSSHHHMFMFINMNMI